MSVLIGSWEFEGPYNEITELRSEPGIVALLCANNEIELIKFDESDSVKDYFANQSINKHRHNSGDHGIATAVYYCADLNSTLRQGLIGKLIKEFEIIE